jgi:glutamate-ammonia-ligase adenylyltransferase
LLSIPAPEPALDVDADLRPEGRQGPLTRSLGSYAAYYLRWSKVWESQALLRARPIAGDPDVGASFVEAIGPVRWPQAGISASDIREVRRIKARVEKERLPRGADPTLNTKLGRGGLSDVEWTVQLLQLEHAADTPSLQVPSTVDALAALAAAGFLDAEQLEALRSAWEVATRARNAIFLVRGRASDQLPRPGLELAGVARAFGYGADMDPGQFLEDYRRTSRHARSVVEHVFYGGPAAG